ncbi:hypothetical protein JB92DRAFT_3127752 [Gautieria morchelliformis]|nr:hypothetical protein JB92DRAFT_3127752 [Gautieria morchelliformis]
MSRHSSFSRSAVRRPWRSPLKPTDPQASLSLVFAEPQHAAGGTAAATILSSSQDSDNPADHPLHRLDRPDAAFERPNTHANGEDPPATSPSPDPVGVDKASNPVRAQTPNHSSVSRQPSQQAGWFGSRGRKPRDNDQDSTRPVDVAVSLDDASNVVLSRS